MVLLTVERISKSYPEQRVLDQVSFGIHENDRIGIIGANGAGKTTLLEIIAGARQPDEGSIVTRKGLRVSYLPQRPGMGPGTTLQHIASRGRSTLALLDRLGFTELDTHLGQLSGGEQRRVALAAALATEADVLILDEPTNHLDIDMIDWLEDRLAERNGALLLVTHDRYLLDRVCNRIMELNDGAIVSHASTYEDFLAARDLREAHLAATERKRRNRARAELAWLRRNPKARTGKSKYRTARAENFLAPRPPTAQEDLRFDLPTRRLGSKIVNLDNVGKCYDDRWVVRNVTLRLAERARIGLVGPNGSGKTTLLRLIGRSLDPDTGKVSWGKTVQVGWYGQEPQHLPVDQRILAAVEDITLRTKLASGVTVSASQLLERFMFPGSQHSARVGELSGGERRRLELLRVLARAPNVLLLDEPTNDLDLDTLRTLEEFLDTWSGAVVVASHDRFFLDRVVSDILALQPDGTVRHHPGGWPEYRAWQVAQPKSTSPKTSGRKEVSRPPRLSFHEVRELADLESRLPELESLAERLQEELDRGPDWETSEALSRRLAAVLSELHTAEDRWLDLSTRYE